MAHKELGIRHKRCNKAEHPLFPWDAKAVASLVKPLELRQLCHCDARTNCHWCRQLRIRLISHFMLGSFSSRTDHQARLAVRPERPAVAAPIQLQCNHVSGNKWPFLRVSYKETWFEYYERVFKWQRSEYWLLKESELQASCKNCAQSPSTQTSQGIYSLKKIDPTF